MKSIQVKYDKKSGQFTLSENKTQESWVEVCERFDDDVHRLMEVTEHPPFTALYECFDENNRPTHFLVEEDPHLKAMRQRVFLRKLGR